MCVLICSHGWLVLAIKTDILFPPPHSTVFGRTLKVIGVNDKHVQRGGASTPIRESKNLPFSRLNSLKNIAASQKLNSIHIPTIVFLTENGELALHKR